MFFCVKSEWRTFELEFLHSGNFQFQTTGNSGILGEVSIS